MKKSTIIIICLAIVLILSNVFWLYQILDFGVSYTYQGVSLEEKDQALSQVLAVLNEVSTPEHTKDSIVSVAQDVLSVSEPFEKDGFLWVGRIGLKFDEHDNLIETTSSY